MPSIPPSTPNTKPATNPPPMIRLNTASGKTTMLPIVPYPSSIRIDPITRMSPMIAPIAKARLGGPRAGNQKNTPTQRL